MGLGKCFAQDQPPKRYLPVENIFEREKQRSSCFSSVWNCFCRPWPNWPPRSCGRSQESSLYDSQLPVYWEICFFDISNSFQEFLGCVKYLNYCKIVPMLGIFETVQTFLFMLYPYETWVSFYVVIWLLEKLQKFWRQFTKVQTLNSLIFVKDFEQKNIKWQELYWSYKNLFETLLKCHELWLALQAVSAVVLSKINTHPINSEIILIVLQCLKRNRAKTEMVCDGRRWFAMVKIGLRLSLMVQNGPWSRMVPDIRDSM